MPDSSHGGHEPGAPGRHMEWTDERTARFWAFESTRPDYYFSYHHSDATLRYFGRWIRPAERIIDIGAGPGFLVERLLEAGNSVAAHEVSTQAARSLVERVGDHPRFLGLVTDENVDAHAEAFDLCFLVEVVEHLSDEQLDAVLSMVSRLVAPGGTLIVTTPNEEDLAQQHVYCPNCEAVFHRWGHVRSWSARTLAESVRDYGFEPVDVSTAYLARDGQRAENALRWLWHRLTRRSHKDPNLLLAAKKSAGAG